MSILSKFKQVFNREEHLEVTFFMTGGQAITTTGVKEITTTKTGEGNFASYSIAWHDGHKPSVFTFALDHIVAIVAVKE